MRTVALLIDTASSWGRGLLRGIAQYARDRARWSFVLEPGGPEARPPARLGDVDGILALVRTRGDLRRLRKAGVPWVDLDFSLTGLAPWPVCVDEAAVADAALDHLLARGLRHVAFVGWKTRTYWETARRRRLLQRHPGLRVYRERAGGWRERQRALGRWLAALPRPSGVIAANDQRGRHVLEAARSAGLRLPDDLAVVGIDNDEVLCEMTVPPLSSVELNTARMGYEGAALLDRRMSGRPVGRRPLRLPPLRVVARRSSDMLAVDDASVAAALRFLRENAHRPIRVADAVRAANVSRKTLELRFRRTLGRTPHDELIGLRLERAADLLARTDWPLKRVAAASGFSYPEHLHAVFRQRKGTTPGEYRKALSSKP